MIRFVQDHTRPFEVFVVRVIAKSDYRGNARSQTGGNRITSYNVCYTKLLRLVGDDRDADELLEAALALASHRVVVKRPRKAPAIAGGKVSFSLEGNAGRFDVYAKRSLKEKA